MPLIAVLAQPEGGQARHKAAAALGLALADVNQRLAGRLPRVLMHEASTTTAEAHAAALEGLGFVVVTLDPALVPDDQQRIIARTVSFEADTLIVADHGDVTHLCPRRALTLIQRGVRRHSSSRKIAVSERHLDVKKALLTGGLLLTKKVERTETKVQQSEEAFVVLERGDGAPDLMLYERQMDYRFLGAEMVASSRVNLDHTWAKLRAFAPATPADERLLAPGFLTALPQSKADPVDLGLALVTLAHRRGVG